MTETPPASDPDVATGLAVKAITRTVVAMAATAVGIGLVGAGAASMAQVENGGAGADVVVPGISVLMVGQLVALVGTALAVWSLVQLLRRRVSDPARNVLGLGRALGLCARFLLAGCIVGVAVWIVVRPGATLSAVLGAIVACQVAFIIGLVRSRLLRPRPAHPTVLGPVTHGPDAHEPHSPEPVVRGLVIPEPNSPGPAAPASGTSSSAERSTPPTA
ncbi:hypothetical protein C8046_15760 [Serinibacter arcticus]|uniref:Uncharacterized protein n=1 Tax=Serinibacter arcticus TaxID=1655435 RepID=A0A2U1ZY76_9MICO|nr:hypothetical protein [Serinibacter arcticus]PWD51883.1 hypothetical protein C8046_15760 [Serinibacter arcticus]